MIDAINKRVYVFYTNALYELDFSSPAAFSDTLPGERRTLFQLASLGHTAAPWSGGAAYNGDLRHVDNYTAPVINYNLTSAYVVSRFPTADAAEPTSWKYAISKIDLPLDAAASRLVGGSPIYDAITEHASAYMAIDPFTNLYTTGGSVYLGLGDGRIYQFEP